MTPDIHLLLLCGGSEAKLWPLSRKSYPKQFAQSNGDHSLFQSSALRVTTPRFAAPTAITADDHHFIVTEHLAAAWIAPADILIEPEARNTEPAICAAVIAGAPTTIEGRIVAFGIRPDRPETGYGCRGSTQAVGSIDETRAQPLAGFVEKPDGATALQPFSGNKYLWNAGIFLFSIDAILAASEAFVPEMQATVRIVMYRGSQDLGFTRLESKPWATLQDFSIDHAVIEKANNLSVLPYSGHWSDLGGWESVGRETNPNAEGHALSGSATVIDCTTVLLRANSEDQQLVAIGLINIIAIGMPDAAPIADKHRVQDVTLPANMLKAQGVAQAETWYQDFRPWGWFESLVIGTRFQVKRVHVNSAAAYSPKTHHRRSEHWIVVGGTARVTVYDTLLLLAENQSVYIPLGALDSMENPGRVPMVLVEVQTRRRLGEDDIIRYGGT